MRILLSTILTFFSLILFSQEEKLKVEVLDKLTKSLFLNGSQNRILDCIYNNLKNDFYESWGSKIIIKISIEEDGTISSLRLMDSRTKQISEEFISQEIIKIQTFQQNGHLGKMFLEIPMFICLR